jgi:hypothetical protein
MERDENLLHTCHQYHPDFVCDSDKCYRLNSYAVQVKLANKRKHRQQFGKMKREARLRGEPVPGQTTFQVKKTEEWKDVTR